MLFLVIIKKKNEFNRYTSLIIYTSNRIADNDYSDYRDINLEKQRIHDEWVRGQVDEDGEEEHPFVKWVKGDNYQVAEEDQSLIISYENKCIKEITEGKEDSLKVIQLTHNLTEQLLEPDIEEEEKITIKSKFHNYLRNQIWQCYWVKRICSPTIDKSNKTKKSNYNN